MDELAEEEIDYAASYEALVEFLYLAPVGIIKFKPDGTIEMANPAAAQLLMPLAEDGDMSDLYRLFAHLAPDLRSHVERFQPDAGQIFDQMQMVVENTRLTLMLDVNKIDPRTLMAVIQNVTDLTEARRQVMRETSSQRLLASVFMGITTPVVVVRSDGFILMSNIAFQTLMEYDAKGVVGLNIDALLPPEYSAAARAARSQQMLNGGCYEVGMQVVSKSGKRSNVLMNSALLREDNHQQFRVVTLIPNVTAARTSAAGQAGRAAGAHNAGPTQVQVISLAVFKRAIGADWPFLASRAIELSETLLRQLVGKDDIVKVGKDNNFVIWFHSSDAERNASILQRAKVGLRRLFTTEFGSRIAARVEAALADGHPAPVKEAAC